MAIDAEMALGLGLLPAIVAGAAVFLVRLQRLPHSVYAWCLRGALALVVPTSIVDTAWELVAELRRPLPTSLSNLIGAIEAVLFVMAEIEFLKLLAPFAPDIRTGIVINFQIALLISAIPYALSAFHSMFDGGLAKTLKTYVSSWPIAAGIFDVGQQVILLLFVLWRLQGATHAFRMRYAAIIASCAAVLLCGLLLSIYVGDNLPNGRQLLREHCIHIFVLLGAMAMEVLRASLYRRPPRAAAPHPNAGITLASAATVLSRTQLESTTDVESPAPDFISMETWRACQPDETARIGAGTEAAHAIVSELAMTRMSASTRIE